MKCFRKTQARGKSKGGQSLQRSEDNRAHQNAMERIRLPMPCGGGGGGDGRWWPVVIGDGGQCLSVMVLVVVAVVVAAVVLAVDRLLFVW